MVAIAASWTVEDLASAHMLHVFAFVERAPYPGRQVVLALSLSIQLPTGSFFARVWYLVTGMGRMYLKFVEPIYLECLKERMMSDIKFEAVAR